MAERPKEPLIEELSSGSDLAAALERLIQEGHVSRDDVKVVLARIMLADREKVEAVLQTELSNQKNRLLDSVKNQYPKIISILDRYRIDVTGSPSWDEIERGLVSANALEVGTKLVEPTLLLVPPISRNAKVKAIDRNQTVMNRSYVQKTNWRQDTLWNGSSVHKLKLWRAALVEGTQEVEPDPTLRGTNYEVCMALLNKLKEQGIDVINDADVYLTLVMKALAEHKPIDARYFTILNAKKITPKTALACGEWRGNHVCLKTIKPHDKDHMPGVYPVLRGMVEIPLIN